MTYPANARPRRPAQRIVCIRASKQTLVDQAHELRTRGDSLCRELAVVAPHWFCPSAPECYEVLFESVRCNYDRGQRISSVRHRRGARLDPAERAQLAEYSFRIQANALAIDKSTNSDFRRICKRNWLFISGGSCSWFGLINRVAKLR